MIHFRYRSSTNDGAARRPGGAGKGGPRCARRSCGAPLRPLGRPARRSWLGTRRRAPMRWGGGAAPPCALRRARRSLAPPPSTPAGPGEGGCAPSRSPGTPGGGSLALRGSPVLRRRSRRRPLSESQGALGRRMPPPFSLRGRETAPAGLVVGHRGGSGVGRRSVVGQKGVATACPSAIPSAMSAPAAGSVAPAPRESSSTRRSATTSVRYRFCPVAASSQLRVWSRPST
jgi:hypothetical protein